MSNFTSVPYPFIEIVKPAIEAENFVYDNTEVAGLFLTQITQLKFFEISLWGNPKFRRTIFCVFW